MPYKYTKHLYQHGFELSFRSMYNYVISFTPSMGLNNVFKTIRIVNIKIFGYVYD